MSHIALVGMMGVGKTSIARIAAADSQMQFWDSDKLVAEYAGKSIESIFAEDGEETFREWEHQVLSDLMHDPEPAVISTGGGVVLREDNRQLLKKKATVVWLQGDLKLIARRLAESPNPRPLVPKGDVSEMEAALADLLAKRQHLYQEVAHRELDVSRMPRSAAVSELLDIVEEIQERNSR